MVAVPRVAERAAPLAPRVPLFLFGALLLAAAGAVGVFQVLQTSRAASMGYELRSLQQQRAALAAEVRLLEAEIALLAGAGEVRARATAELGMVPPGETMRVSVSVPAPFVVPMPERYVEAVPATVAAGAAWWERLLRGIPGFD